jgi:hypothetical protein
VEPFVCIQLRRYLLSCPEMDTTPREERKKRREQEDEEVKHTVMRIGSLFGACWRRLTEFSGKAWPLLHTHAGCRTKCHGLAVKNCGRGDMAPVPHTQTHPADPPQDYLLPTHHKYCFILLMKIPPLSLIA